MDHFQYRDGELHAEAVPLRGIADAVGTPFYCYSTATLVRHYGVFADAVSGLDATVCFAVKANSNIAVLATLARLGAGADVVSAGELKRALVAGIPASKVVFSGVGKTADEMAAALKAGVMQINVESLAELETLSGVAGAIGLDAPVAIRVNPDVDAMTHEKIATGKMENKFGIDWADARAAYGRAAGLPGIRPVGIAVHIGSQVMDLDPFRQAYGRIVEMVALLEQDGITIERVDLGGGLAIPYDGEVPPTPEAYGEMAVAALGGLGRPVIFEPGRLIAGNAGILVTRIIHIKQGQSRRFVIVDAAMNDLLRPALYNARHAIVPVAEPERDAPLQEVEVVGPICETGDTFGGARSLPALFAGDLVAIRTAGAYGAVMASTYNTRPLVAEVLVNDDAFDVIRQRITVDDLLARESLPPWLEQGVLGAGVSDK